MPERGQMAGRGSIIFLPRPKETFPKFKAFFIKNILVFMFGFGAIIGLSVPFIGKKLASYKSSGWTIASTLCVSIIFFIQGLNLSTDAVKRALSAWKLSVFGICSILFITPLLSFVPLSLDFKTPEFQRGLALFCNMPTTIASGVALVGQAGGNTAHALLLTVFSNMLGILTVPFYLNLILTATEDIDISPVPLLQKLLVTILMPLVVGKVLQELSRYYEVQLGWINAFFTQNKFKTKMMTNFCLALIVWMKFSQSASALLGAPGLDVLFVILAANMLHVMMLAFNYGSMKLLKIDSKNPKEFRATLIMASQKTLPFAVTVISFLDESVGEAGLLTIPCILMHLSQLFVDAYIASYYGAKKEDEDPVILSPRNTTFVKQASLNSASFRDVLAKQMSLSEINSPVDKVTPIVKPTSSRSPSPGVKPSPQEGSNPDSTRIRRQVSFRDVQTQFSAPREAQISPELQENKVEQDLEKGNN
mmetsp:Transcript_23452/g.30640  ORF Transcript_23452/g.30640 Transcript_23452/m.30640 type:complete len:477 (+) Transcript_23452:230-1660(+)